MANSILAALLAGALALSPAASRAQVAITIAGGITAPVSTLGDIADLGYHLSGGVNYGIPTSSLGFRFEGGYDGLSLKNGGGDVRILAGTVNVIGNMGTTRDAPYVIAGIGAYNRNISTTTLGYGNGKTVLGINGGGGLRFPLNGISTYFEARYHVMLGEQAAGANYQFIPMTFGIVF